MCPYLRLFLLQLQKLFEDHAFWAKGRSLIGIRKLLKNSNAVISVWSDTKLIGFGRATTDGIYRAVLWDIVVKEDSQRRGCGRAIVQALLNNASVNCAERIYIMTTYCSAFYEELGFIHCNEQGLLEKQRKVY